VINCGYGRKKESEEQAEEAEEKRR
jgi:hypothetical protein